MSEVQKKCMICGKAAADFKGGICEPCQDRIRREALANRRALVTGPIAS